MIIAFAIGETIDNEFAKGVYCLDNKKTYPQWNGKNIHGEAELNNSFLSKEAANSNTSEMNYVVGVDTFSGDELQEDMKY